MKTIDFETMLGGITSVIAIIAIIIQMDINGFTTDSITGGVKDISTTVVALLVLIVAVRKLRPKKEKLGFDELMNSALDQWSKRNYPLITRKEVISKKVNSKDVTLQRYFMLTDNEHLFDFAKDSVVENWKTGLFVEIPEIKEENYNTPTIVFHLNESTFLKKLDPNKDIKDQLKSLSHKFSEAALNNFKTIISSADDKSNSITIRFENNIKTNEEIKAFVDVLEYVMTLYIIAS